MTLLPETYEQGTIRNMLPGDQAYVLPRAMWADENRVLWIHGGYPINLISVIPFDTSHLLIERTHTGVAIDPSTIEDHKYKPGEPCFVGGVDPLPVEFATITRSRTEQLPQHDTVQQILPPVTQKKY